MKYFEVRILSFIVIRTMVCLRCSYMYVTSYVGVKAACVTSFACVIRTSKYHFTIIIYNSRYDT